MVDTSALCLLSPDTRATVLLCANGGREASKVVKPLKPVEYDLLYHWLHANAMQPKDLLGSTETTLHGNGDPPIAVDRLLTLLDRDIALASSMERWTANGLWIVSRHDPWYPRRLAQRLGRTTPPLLYGIGNPDLLSSGGLAIVGSRDADERALDFTRGVAQAAAAQALTIVSGGARGIDSGVMNAAQERGGTVVGILADNLTKAATAAKEQAALIDGRLVLVSTYDPDAPFSVGSAMGRNKYIYALAGWTLVVSTGLDAGGTWAGAQEGLKKGRHVFVRMEADVSTGNYKLMELGALAFPAKPWSRLRETLVAICDAYGMASETAPDVEPDDAIEQSQPQTAYDASLALLLSHLETPCDKHTLAERLELRPDQLQQWLIRARREGRIETVKGSKPVQYVVNQQRPLLIVREQPVEYPSEQLAGESSNVQT